MTPPRSPPWIPFSLRLSLSPSARTVAGQLSGELSAFWDQLGMTCQGWGGQDEGGGCALFLSLLLGSQLVPQSPSTSSPLFPFFFPPPSSCIPLPVLPSPCLRNRAQQAVNQLLPCLKGKMSGREKESTPPCFSLLLVSGDKCRCHSEVKRRKERHCFLFMTSSTAKKICLNCRFNPKLQGYWARVFNNTKWNFFRTS